MKKYFPAGLCGFLLAVSFGASAHGPHVHGTAELHLVIDNHVLAIELHGPLENFLGFEHPPRTAAQRLAVQNMMAKLNDPITLFGLPKGASCRAGTTQIDAPVTAASESKGTVKDADGDDHADLTADFQFTCDQIDMLDTIEVNIFDAFSGTHTIKAEIIGPHGQSATTLTLNQRSVRF